MKEKRGIRRFLRLAGMAAVLTAGMAGAKPDKVQAEQMVPEMSVLSAEGNGLDSNTGAAGKVILKQSLKEEELAALKQPELSYTDENGTEYRLADWEVREVPGLTKSCTLEKTALYQAVEGAETLPPYIDSRENEDGTQLSGRLYMKESRILKEEWRDDFRVPVTFYSYGADAYELGEITVSGENALASVLEEQERLLGEMGLSPEDYRITSIDWDGESFMDEEGQVCRLALAGGERRLRDYEAIYSGQVQAEEPVSYEVSAIYEAARESAGEDTVPDIQEETGENERPSPLPDRYSRWVQTGVVITIAAGFFGLILGIFLLAMSRRRRRKEREEEFEYS